MERKYPTKMFWFFVLTNFLFHFFYLSLPGMILCFIGIWVKSCLKIGLVILFIDLILSIIEQMRIRKAALTSTHPDVMELMDVLNGPEGIHGVKEWTDKRIAESTPVEPSDEDI